MTPNEQYDAAITLRDAGKTDDALSALEALVSQTPDFKLGYQGLAVMYQKADRCDEAIAAAKKVVELDPDDTFSYTQLSVIAQRCGRIEEAEIALARGGGRPMP